MLTLEASKQKETAKDVIRNTSINLESLEAMGLDLFKTGDDEFGESNIAKVEKSSTPSEPREEVQITVKNPTVMKDGALSKNYIIYDVEGKDKEGEFKVKRRFNDFFQLRSKLVENWLGIVIPPLPEKRLKGNTASEFVLERKTLLDYFVKRCSRLPHIYYSAEMQTFIRGTDEQFKKKFGEKSQVTPQELLVLYQEKFKRNAEKELGEDTVATTDKHFGNLKMTIEFFKNFLKIGKWQSRLAKKNSLDYSNFIKSAVGDYKRKLSVQDQEKSLAKYNTFVRMKLTKIESITQDDTKKFIETIKELLLEFQALEEVRDSIKIIMRQTEDYRRRQTETNKEISRLKSSDIESLNKGVFGGKIPKADKIKELDDVLQKQTDTLDALTKLRVISYNILSNVEFPRVVVS